MKAGRTEEEGCGGVGPRGGWRPGIAHDLRDHSFSVAED